MAWNRPNEAAKPAPKKSPGVMRGAIAGAAVVVIAAVCFFIFSGEEEKPAPKVEKKPRVVEEVKPAPKIKEAPVSKPTPKSEKPKVGFMKLTPKQKEAKIEEMIQKPLDLTPPTNQTFKTGTEQVLSWMFTRQLGDPPPVLPQISLRDEAHLTEILNNVVEAKEGDSEQTKFAKEMVQAAKDELKKYIENGGDVHEFLGYYRGLLVQAHNEWKACQQELIKMVREDPAMIPDYRDALNKKLDEKGIKHVDIPPFLKKKYGID